MGMKYYPTYVPDEGPLDAKILFVGEAPGENEVEERKPFVGTAGQTLLSCLNRAGVSRDEVRLANLCHYRPVMNKFENLLHEEVLNEGLNELFQYITDHNPNVIVPLGNWPLHYLTQLARFNNKGQISGITKWRGSIVDYVRDTSLKCIPTFHPSYVARDPSQYPTFDVDIRRIVADAIFREKNYRAREYVINPRGVALEEWTEKLCAAPYLAVDLETVKKSSHILCVGFAPSPNLAVCIVPTHETSRLAISRILESPARKIFQFGSFDTQQLFINGFTVNNYYWDTLIAQHILAPELPRSLEYLGSIYTREPYYKKGGRANIPDDAKSWSEKFDKDALYEYNCKDCCITAEVYEAQLPEIEAHPSKEIFKFEIEALEVAGHISLNGMLIDNERRKLLEFVLANKWARKQMGLDALVGRDVNVNSTKIVPHILYDKEFLGLPIRRNRAGGITADEDAIVSLMSYCKDRIESVVKDETKQAWKEKLAICKAILEIRGIRKSLSTYIKLRLGTDGRLRSTYKVGGTETGRWSATQFVDGSGINSQTLPRDPVEFSDEAFELAKKLIAQLENEIENEDEDEDDEID